MIQEIDQLWLRCKFTPYRVLLNPVDIDHVMSLMSQKGNVNRAMGDMMMNKIFELLICWRAGCCVIDVFEVVACY